MPDDRLYTKQELIAHAKSRRVLVTSAQFDEWKQHGLLPVPTPEPNPPRGRPRLLYPERALGLIVWLGTHRRSIEGDDVARFWLWLDGYSHIQLDPALFLLAQIQLAWDELRTAVPSLPDIAHVAQRGMSEDQITAALDEWDTSVTRPLYESGELDERTLPRTYLEALLYGVAPPEWVDPAYGDMLAEASALYGLPLNDQRLQGVAKHLPHLVRASSLSVLYRRLFTWAEWTRDREYLTTHAQELDTEAVSRLCAKANRALFTALSPHSLRAWWQFLTPEMIDTYWRGGPGGVPRLRSRAELLRYWRYDPLQFVMFAADTQDRLERALHRKEQGLVG
jgi:hypothetical protein